MFTIGIDLDGTLSESIENTLSASQIEKFRKLYNKFRVKEPKSLQGKAMEFAMRKFFDYKWRHWENVKLLSDDIPQAIEDLSKIAKILIITSTFGKKEYIENWLEANGIVYDGIIFASPNEKWKYCDMLIDDRLDVIREATKRNKIGILISEKEKTNYGENIIMANNWEDVVEAIEKLSFN